MVERDSLCHLLARLLRKSRHALEPAGCLRLGKHCELCKLLIHIIEDLQKFADRFLLADIETVYFRVRLLYVILKGGDGRREDRKLLFLLARITTARQTECPQQGSSDQQIFFACKPFVHFPRFLCMIHSIIYTLS